MARVSVVMAVYNAAHFLPESVGSILSQTFRDFELILINDCSKDDSLSVINGFKDDRIRVIDNVANKGAAESRNVGMAAATGEFVAIMDADDISSPTRLEAQVAFLDARPEIGLVGCAVYDNIDVDGTILYTSHLPEDNDAIQRTLIEKWCFLHPSIMFRRESYLKVGGYRKQFEPAEDHDFILRVLEHCKAHNLPGKLVQYRINPKGLSVVGHGYINQLGEAAMQLAQERRQGKDEQGELSRLSEEMRLREESGPMARMIQWGRNSLYASNRYYGFGCRELYAGNLKHARKCFVRSLGNNCLFMKSWIGLSLTFFPFAVDRLKFAFKASMQYHQELEKQRGSA